MPHTEAADITSYLDRAGEQVFLMRALTNASRTQDADRLEALIVEQFLDVPRAARLMWGSTGTMLAALFLHRRTGEARSASFRAAARERCRRDSLMATEHECHYWTQDLYGQHSSVHGRGAWLRRDRVAADRGRALLPEEEWTQWRMHRANGDSDGDARRSLANWRPRLAAPADAAPMLMQYCHGAPGFIVCLADFPDTTLDGSSLPAAKRSGRRDRCARARIFATARQATATRSSALRRTGNPIWLERARAFAMHAMAQSEADEARFGGLRYSLWTSDPGLAIFLWDCIRSTAAFPTVDVFYGD